MRAPAPGWRDRLVSFWCRRRWRGFNTVRRALLRGTGVPNIRYRTRYGTCFLLDGSAYIDTLVLREGYYESEVLEALLSALPNAGVLWDVGANFGLHAVTLARLRPDARVIAFEPNHHELTRLRAHSEANGVAVVVSPLALSDATGHMTLHLGPPGNSGMSTLRAWSGLRASGSVDVEVVCGDTLVAQGALPMPNAIKIDVEGHEAAVLRGLAHTLRDPRCTCVVFEDSARADSETKALLHAAGFTVTALERREHSEHALHNYVARKASAP